jgi:hypothetical protein
MEISILGSQKSLHIVECLLYSQPPYGIIRTTADLIFLPYGSTLWVYRRPCNLFCLRTPLPGQSSNCDSAFFVRLRLRMQLLAASAFLHCYDRLPELSFLFTAGCNYFHSGGEKNYFKQSVCPRKDFTSRARAPRLKLHSDDLFWAFIVRLRPGRDDKAPPTDSYSGKRASAVVRGAA